LCGAIWKAVALQDHWSKRSALEPIPNPSAVIPLKNLASDTFPPKKSFQKRQREKWRREKESNMKLLAKVKKLEPIMQVSDKKPSQKALEEKEYTIDLKKEPLTLGMLSCYKCECKVI
jgi:hypothetical protein